MIGAELGMSAGPGLGAGGRADPVLLRGVPRVAPVLPLSTCAVQGARTSGKNFVEDLGFVGVSGVSALGRTGLLRSVDGEQVLALLILSCTRFRFLQDLFYMWPELPTMQAAFHSV